MSTLPTSFEPLSPESPWPGLRPFTEVDDKFFFGREEETKALLDLIEHSPVVVLYGRSGLGKTSLLQAGLCPELKKKELLPVTVRLDYSGACGALEEQLMERLTIALDRAGLRGPRPGPGERLWTYFHRSDVCFWGPKNRLYTPVIVLDQFEEIFTLGKRADMSGRVARFQAELESVIEHRIPDDIRQRLENDAQEAARFNFRQQAVRFVISLREDFLAHLTDWVERIPSLLEHKLHVSDLTEAKALHVIKKTGGRLVTNEVARDIVVFLTATQRRPGPTAERPRVEPALLSVVCDELNRCRLQRGEEQITSTLLDVNRDAIIQDFYERSFDGINENVREWVEEHLLTKSGYRTRAAQEDAKLAGASDVALGELVKRRLLQREEHDGVMWLELSHDLVAAPAMLSLAIRAERRETDAANKRAEAERRDSEAAKKHAAEVAAQLLRTRRLNYAFAATLLVMLVCLGFAIWGIERANAATARATDAIAKKVVAQQVANEMRDLATAQFNNLFTLTKNLVPMADGDRWAPTVTLRTTIENVAATYVTLSERRSNSVLAIERAHFLARSAETLYQAGRITEGLRRAESTVQALQGVNDDTALAEAEVALGRGNLEFGRLTAAAGHFAKAAALASTNTEQVRTYVMAKLGLARVERGRMNHSAAAKHLEDAAAVLQHSGTPKHDVRAQVWQAMIDLQIAATADDYAAVYPKLKQSQQAIGQLRNKVPANFVIQRLSADIDYQCGLTEMRFRRYRDAEASFGRSRATNLALVARDPQNLEWTLAFARSCRGLGLALFHRSPLLAEASLDEAQRAVDVVRNGEKDWLQAQTLAAAVVSSHGQAAFERAHPRPIPAIDADTETEEAPDPGGEELRVRQEKERAAAQFRRAKAMYEEIMRRNRECGVCASDLASVTHSMARIAYSARKYEDAAAYALAAAETLNGLPSNRDIDEDRARYLLYAGRSRIQLKQRKEAVRQMEVALRYFDRIRNTTTVGDEDVAFTHLLIGYVQMIDNDLPAALRHLDSAARAIDAALRNANSDTDRIDRLEDKAQIFDIRARVLRDSGDLAGMVTSLQVATAAVNDGLSLAYGDAYLHQDRESLQSFRHRVETELTTVIGNGTAISSEAYALRERLREVPLVTVDKLIDPVKVGRWTVGPLVPGLWHSVPKSELQHATRGLPDAYRRIGAARKLALKFYDDATLYESEIEIMRNGVTGVIDWVVRPGETILVDGRPDTLRTLNQRRPRLDTVDNVAAYLRFFIGAFNGPEGRSIVVDAEHDLVWPPEVARQERQWAASMIKPLSVERSANGAWNAIGTVQYRGRLFPTIFEVKPDGSVTKQFGTSERYAFPLVAQLFADNGIRHNDTPEEQLQRLRVKLSSREESQKNEAMRALPHAYARLKKWGEAVQAEREWIDSLQKSGGSTDDLVAGYLALSWYQLMKGGDYEDALASAEAGKRLDPEYLSLETNRAHALLLLGRYEEAEAIYREHRGKPLSGKKWDDVILEDLKALENEGVFTTNPEVIKVRQLLAAGK